MEGVSVNVPLRYRGHRIDLRPGRGVEHPLEVQKGKG